MLKRMRRFAVDLHEDESGPNTVEWILLIIIALILLIAILLLANWAREKFTKKREAVEKDKFFQ